MRQTKLEREVGRIDSSNCLRPTQTSSMHPEDMPSKDFSQTNQKRGMKPRSKRNRKRPRSERHALEEAISHKIHVLPLELDGRAIHASDPTWIRTVEAYPYTFSTFAKARWLGRTLLDVYSTEFGSYPKSYYETAISQGRILVSDQTVSVDHIIQGGDILTHTVHRHEPSVAVSLKDPPYLRILHEDDNVLVMDKPGTLPIHPCGGYHVQSLMSMLEPSYGKLYTIHRLDRLTSGLVILGRTSAIAADWGKAIMDRNCEKVYLARVAGKFPTKAPKELSRFTEQATLPHHGELQKTPALEGTDKPVNSVAFARKRNAHGYWISDPEGSLQPDCQLEDVFAAQHAKGEWLIAKDEKSDKSTTLNWFHFACPTRIAQHKDGICEAGHFQDLDDALYAKTVKPAETAFGVIRYDEASDSTLVICRPKTGRTHQIRLHLQHLGHPIANDPNYGGSIWYGNSEGQEACRIAQERLNAIASTNCQNSDKSAATRDAGDRQSTSTIDLPATEGEIQQGVTAAVRQEREDIHDFIRRTCVWCTRSQKTSGDTPRDILEFLVRSPGIWLHAFQYTFDDTNSDKSYCFCSPAPKWAECPSKSGGN